MLYSFVFELFLSLYCLGRIFFVVTCVFKWYLNDLKHNINFCIFGLAVLEYYHAHLEPLVQYSYLRTDVFQAFREIGNGILFIILIEQSMVS